MLTEYTPPGKLNIHLMHTFLDTAVNIDQVLT